MADNAEGKNRCNLNRNHGPWTPSRDRVRAFRYRVLCYICGVQQLEIGRVSSSTGASTGPLLWDLDLHGKMKFEQTTLGAVST